MIPELFLQRSHIDFVSMGISLDMVDKWTTIGPNSRPSVLKGHLLSCTFLHSLLGQRTEFDFLDSGLAICSSSNWHMCPLTE